MSTGPENHPRHHPSTSPAPTGTPTGTEPEELSAEEIADYEQLRNLVSPEKSLALLDDFAKWLFVVAAAVGTVGTGFGVTNSDDLSGGGKTLFGCAVVLVAFSLALAAFARLPIPGRVNRYSDVSLRKHVALVLKVRGVLLSLAVVLFTAALVLAGLSGVVS